MADIYEEYKNLKSFEVEFFDNVYKHRIMCKIKNIEPDKVVIVSDNTSNDNVLPKVGDELTLNVYSDNGIYSSVANVLSVEQKDSLTFYSITYPAQNKITQRREYFRADLKIPFVMKIERETKTDILEGETVNICGKGICFKSSKPFLPYKSINLVLKFKNKTVESQAEYVYSRNSAENGMPLFLHAFMLTSITQENIDFIVGQCFLYQLS